MDFDTLVAILTVVGSVLTVYATYITFLKKKKADYLANVDCMSKGRSTYSDMMMRAYRRHHPCRYDGCHIDRSSHLLKPCFLGRSPWDGVRALQDVGIAVTSRRRTFTGVRFTEGLTRRFRRFHDAFSYLPNSLHLHSYNARRHLGRKIMNRELFYITAVDHEGDGIGLELGTTGYYSYYNSCEYLAFTTVCRINGVMESRWRGISRSGERMEARLDRVADRCLVDIWDFEGRCVSIGVCTLTVFHHVDGTAGRNLFLIHRRSDTVGEAANTVSVVPAGSFEPNGGGSDALRQNVIREFEEEVLGRRETEFSEGFRDDIPEGMDMYYLTMGLDPLTTKMEMATLLTIDCRSGQVIDFLKRYVDDFRPERENISERNIRNLLKHASSEGSIFSEPFETDILRRYENCSEGMPILKECMRLAILHHDWILGRVDTDDATAQMNRCAISLGNEVRNTSEAGRIDELARGGRRVPA